MKKKICKSLALLICFIIFCCAWGENAVHADSVVYDTITISSENIDAEYNYGDDIELYFTLDTNNTTYLEYYYVQVFNSSNKEVFYYRGTFNRANGAPYTASYTVSLGTSYAVGTYRVKAYTTYDKTGTTTYFQVKEKTCNHIIVTDPAIAATCTTAGKTEGSHCSVCGEVIKAQTSIAATGHKAVTDPAVAATCTTAGKTEGSHCSVCGEVIKAQTSIAATGHKAVTDPAVAATCTTAGKTEGSHCSVCGEVIKAQTSIAATGHKAVTDPAVAATCTTAGKTEGSHCSVCGKVIKAQTSIAATGHKAVTDPAVAATCTTAGKTEGSHCSVCGEVIKAQTTVGALGHSVVTDEGYEATYMSTGLTEGTHCSVCSIVLTEQTVIERLPLPFKDVSDNSWYANAVRLMLDRGIMNGTSATTFGPSESLTRAQLVVMLWNFEGRPAAEYTNAFPDVPNGKYYTKAVEWARTTGVVNGSNGRFYPGNAITRQDFAVILKNYAAYKQLDTQIVQPNAYTACWDYKNVSSYAKSSIQWAYERNLIGANGSLFPKDNITRGEAAAMLQRFLLFFGL